MEAVGIEPTSSQVPLRALPVEHLFAPVKAPSQTLA